MSPDAVQDCSATRQRALHPALATAAWSPALSPDARQLAYVTDREGFPRLCLRDLHEGRERTLDTGPAHVQSVRWSVEGDWLSVQVAPGGGPCTQVWVLRPDGRDLHRIAPPHDEGATLLGPWTHRPGVLAVSQSASVHAAGCAWLQDAASDERWELTSGDQPLVLDLDRKNRWALVRRGPRGARSVWAVDRETGAEQQLIARGGTGSTDLGRLSPDSRVAYLRSNAGGEMFGLFAVPLFAAGDSPLLLAERAEAELDNMLLTADGGSALLIWNFAGRSECQLLRLTDGKCLDIALPEPVAHDGSFSGDGRFLALTLEGPTHPRAVWLYDIERSSWLQLTRQPPGLIAEGVHPTLEFLRAEDGLQITGWLYRAEEDTGRALIHLHGGPEAQERPTWNPLFQELARAGITVFAPNVRGSSGFGRSFMTADDREKRWGAMRDVAECVRHLVRTGVARQGHIAVGGRSYGGYLTLAMLVFHPDLFMAGIDVCGMVDLQTFYANTEPFIAIAAYPKYGHPVHDAELLRALSPIHHFDALRAPLLVVHGQNDSNVPLEEAEQVVAAARARNIPVRYLLFKDEGHELAQPHNREIFVRVTVDWLLDVFEER
ncbi:MAG TPA: prolyl oligopeptidase family serine peptidase [Polyangiales bacterium]|nr:prolyl oligopeptidase family serine peptidase [Polyangiales bacterium]